VRLLTQDSRYLGNVRTLGIAVALLALCVGAASAAPLDRQQGRQSDDGTLADLQRLERRLAADPNDLEALYEASWLQTVSDDPEIRDVEAGLQHAKRLVAITNYKQRAVRDSSISKAFRIQALYVMGIAYASNGNYLQAMPYAALASQASGRMNEVSPSKESAMLVDATASAEVLIRANSPQQATEAEEQVGASSGMEQNMTLLGQIPFVAGEAVVRLDIPVGG